MRKVTPEGSSRRRDLVVVEEPLTILWQASDGPSQKLSATMRTPGEDVELAAGLLFHEGLLRHPDELHSLNSIGSEPNCASSSGWPSSDWPTILPS
jgi:FdhD protein